MHFVAMKAREIIIWLATGRSKAFFGERVHDQPPFGVWLALKGIL